MEGPIHNGDIGQRDPTPPLPLPFLPPRPRISRCRRFPFIRSVSYPPHPTPDFYYVGSPRSFEVVYVCVFWCVREPVCLLRLFVYVCAYVCMYVCSLPPNPLRQPVALCGSHWRQESKSCRQELSRLARASPTSQRSHGGDRRACH